MRWKVHLFRRRVSLGLYKQKIKFKKRLGMRIVRTALFLTRHGMVKCIIIGKNNLYERVLVYLFCWEDPITLNYVEAIEPEDTYAIRRINLAYELYMQTEQRSI